MNGRSGSGVTVSVGGVAGAVGTGADSGAAARARAAPAADVDLTGCVGPVGRPPAGRVCAARICVAWGCVVWGWVAWGCVVWAAVGAGVTVTVTRGAAGAGIGRGVTVAATRGAGRAATGTVGVSSGTVAADPTCAGNGTDLFVEGAPDAPTAAAIDRAATGGYSVAAASRSRLARSRLPSVRNCPQAARIS